VTINEGFIKDPQLLLNKMSAMYCCLCDEGKSLRFKLAKSEIVAAISGIMDRMIGWGTATTILPKDVLFCCPCLRIVKRLVR